MKRSNDSINRMNEKCLLLEGLGFTINHQDSEVEFNGYCFDFSATSCDSASILYTAMNKMFENGRAVGRIEIQKGIKKLLNLDGYDDK